MKKKLKLDFSDSENLPDEVWYSMVDANMSLPVELNDKNIKQAFVYDRDYGVFHVPFGYHNIALSNILAWNMGYERYNDIPEFFKEEILNGKKSEFYSDYLLENFKGIAFLSSISDTIYTGYKNTLNDFEKEILYPLVYIFK